jgi:hypothetical protein
MMGCTREGFGVRVILVDIDRRFMMLLPRWAEAIPALDVYGKMILYHQKRRGDDGTRCYLSATWRKPDMSDELE